VLLRAGDATAIRSSVDPQGDYAVHNVRSGSYFVVYAGKEGRRVVMGRLGDAPEPPLEGAIGDAVGGAREFFEEKKLLALGVVDRRGSKRDFVRALVGLRRTGRTSAGNQTYVRYERWKLEKLTPRWEITERVYLYREVIPPGTAHTWPKITVVEGLEKVAVTAKGGTLPLAEKVTRALSTEGRP
jgi:hypothetical protein